MRLNRDVFEEKEVEICRIRGFLGESGGKLGRYIKGLE